MLGWAVAASEVLAVGDPGRGRRRGMLQTGRGEASQAEDSCAGSGEVLAVWLGR